MSYSNVKIKKFENLEEYEQYQVTQHLSPLLSGECVQYNCEGSLHEMKIVENGSGWEICVGRLMQ